MSDDHVRTAQRADSERHPLRVITNAHDGVDVLPNCATLVERAVDVVDGDGAVECTGGHTMATDKGGVKETCRRTTVKEGLRIKGGVRGW